ncbi:MAG: helix-turn-helix transcriptional regulator [Bifidobacteriaceae bacterium]|jgi:transcriptional regulator with XRE-family HTH domain|nr:helix-turn-helix transcriptional regulator [Bifidobacteriaceae bacterium]
MDSYGHQFNAAVAAELRAERAARQLTIRDVVSRSGLPEITVIRYLNDQRAIPVPALYAISQALGVEPGAMLDRAAIRVKAQQG